MKKSKTSEVDATENTTRLVEISAMPLSQLRRDNFRFGSRYIYFRHKPKSDNNKMCASFGNIFSTYLRTWGKTIFALTAIICVFPL